MTSAGRVSGVAQGQAPPKIALGLALLDLRPLTIRFSGTAAVAPKAVKPMTSPKRSFTSSKLTPSSE